MTTRTAFLWIMIVSFAVTALVGIVVILLPDMIGPDEEVLVTALLLGLYSLPPLACSIVIGRGRLVPFMWIGVVAAPIAWLMWMPLVWGSPYSWTFLGIDWSEFLFKVGFPATFIALWITHYGLLDLLRLDHHIHRLVRTGSRWCAGLITWIGIFAIWFEWEEEWLARLIGVLAILVSCGSVITPILALLEFIKRRTTGDTVPARIAIDVRCPRCQTMQTMKAGANTCTNCKLRMQIEVEEPRCACGYLLYQLHGDHCPECGRAIPEDQRWAMQGDQSIAE